MTDKGTFVFNRTERVVVSQIIVRQEFSLTMIKERLIHPVNFYFQAELYHIAGLG